MTLLPMDQFVTFEKRSDISILRTNRKTELHFVKSNTVLVSSYAFNHCSGHIATKKRNSHGFVFVRCGGPDVASMLLKVIFLVLLVKEAMDLWHISPAFA
jgi:hypothetical protein